MVLLNQMSRECSSMEDLPMRVSYSGILPEPSKLMTRVRFPLPAPDGELDEMENKKKSVKTKN